MGRSDLPTLSLLVTVRALRRDPLGTLIQWQAQHGDRLRLARGSRWVLLLSHPDDVRAVLRHPKLIKDARYDSLSRLVGPTSPVTANGAVWRASRRAVAPLFAQPALDAALSRVSESLRAEGSLVPTGTPVDVASMADRRVLEALGRWLLGEAGVDSALVTLLPQAHAQVHSLLGPQVRERGEGSDALHHLDQHARRMVAERRRAAARGAPWVPFADVLAQLGDSEARDQLVTLLIAGYDTTAAALAWTVVRLAECPEVAQRVRTELRSTDGAVPMEALDLTGRVLAEVLRLHPPVWLLGRTAVEPVEIRGLAVKPGDWLTISPYVVHRHPDVWEAPQDFRPLDRPWPPPPAWMPFATGPRGCLGEALARRLLPMVLRAVLESGVPQPVAAATPRPLVSLRPVGARVRIEPV